MKKNNEVEKELSDNKKKSSQYQRRFKVILALLSFIGGFGIGAGLLICDAYI
jgi:uncharacterized protein YeeX (DUF496 family)